MMEKPSNYELMCRKSSEGGFLITEVMVASVIFILGIQVAIVAMGVAESMRLTAVRRHDATHLVQQVASQLRTLNTSDCPGNSNLATELLSDRISGNSLACFGTDSSIGGCEPDYPRSAYEEEDLTSVIGDSIGSDEITPIQDLGEVLMEVGVDATRYRVVWNISCDIPITGNKTVQVTVGWYPFADAIADSRFVSTQFVKGVGF